MCKVFILYWSGTGNTESMAEMIGKGVRETGAEAVITEMSFFDPKELKAVKAFALGCPSMGNEQLEEYTAEPFMEKLESVISGKQIGLFGSYDWGDGEWMREWEVRVKQAKASVINGQGIITRELPDDEAEEKCLKLGEELAKIEKNE